MNRHDANDRSSRYREHAAVYAHACGQDAHHSNLHHPVHQYGAHLRTEVRLKRLHVCGAWPSQLLRGNAKIKPPLAGAWRKPKHSCNQQGLACLRFKKVVVYLGGICSTGKDFELILDIQLFH